MARPLPEQLCRLEPAAPRVLEALCGQWRELLGERLIAVLLWGSALTPDYVPGGSDLDLLVVVAPEPSELDATALLEVHRHAEQLEPAFTARLDVCYVAHQALRAPSAATERRLLCASRGDPFESWPVSAGLVNWWALGEASVALFGPPPADLLPELDRAAVRAALLERIAAWRYYEPAGRPRGERAFRTLTACRTVASLVLDRQVTKSEAARWAMLRLPGLAATIAAAEACRASGYRAGFDDAAAIEGTRRVIALSIELAESALEHHS